MNGPILIRKPDFEKPFLIRPAAQTPRRTSRLVAKSLGFTLFIVGLLLMVGQFRHFASERGVSKQLARLSPPKFVRPDQGRNLAEISDPDKAVAVYPHSKPTQKMPAGRTTVDVYLPPKPSPKTSADIYLPLITPSQKTPVALTKPVEVPMPDLASVSSPDQYTLDENLTGLPSAPPIDPAHATIAQASSGATSADANAVIAALEKYSHAWNTKRVAEITELRPRLARRTVKQELSSASSIVMRIQPTSVPRIQGNRATVECIHQVHQVFTDGVEKQNPGVKMTYVLVRDGGNWLIEESR